MGRQKYSKVNGSTKSDMKGQKSVQTSIMETDYQQMNKHLEKSFLLIWVGNNADLCRNNAKRDFPARFCGNSRQWPFTNY